MYVCVYVCMYVCMYGWMDVCKDRLFYNKERCISDDGIKSITELHAQSARVISPAKFMRVN